MAVPVVPCPVAVISFGLLVGERIVNLIVLTEEESAASQWAVVVSPRVGYCVVKARAVIFGGPGVRVVFVWVQVVVLEQ